MSFLEEPWQPCLDWESPAGKILLSLAGVLPENVSFTITVFGSAPLQMGIEKALLSNDVDIFSNRDLKAVVESNGLGRGSREVYVQVCDELNFQTSPRWRVRAHSIQRQKCTFIFPHPLDILIGKLNRLEPKDLHAFQVVIDKTGHPTETELKEELQHSLDLFRPKFDEEAPGDIMANTVILWHEIFHRTIDVRCEILMPALQKIREGYAPDLPKKDYKQILLQKND